MKKIFSKLHLWLSVPLGLIITVICISGAILVFEKELLELTVPDRYFAKEITEKPLSIEALIPMVNAQLDSATVTFVQIPSDPGRNYIMGSSKGFRTSVYVNPYTGKVIDSTEFRGSFFGTMMQLHRWLLDGTRQIGKSIVGYSTLLFVFILISGIVIWWPKSKKHAKQRAKIVTRFGAKRFWMDMHTNMGMYLMLGLLILSLTGLTYSFRWFNRGFYKMLGIEISAYPKASHGKGGSANNASSNGMGKRNPNTQEKDKVKGGARTGYEEEENKEINYTRWDNVYAELKSINPEFKSISIQNGTASVTQNHTFGNTRASDKYSFDVESGKIIKTELYKNQPSASKARGWIYTIHTGTWGGLFSKILTFLVALIGGSLPLTGYYIFYTRRKRRIKGKR